MIGDILYNGGSAMKIGLIGFGSMGKTHAYAVQNLPYFYRDPSLSFEIGGVCTAHAETAEEAAMRYHLGRAVTDEDTLIYDDAIDVIDVCTPNRYHYETVKKALVAGKHVYCEKPLTVTYQQAAELAALAKETGVTAQIVFNNRFMSGIMRAKELIDEGRLGRIISFRSAYLHASCTDLSRNAGWKQDREICGGGVLFDLGSHALDLIYHLCGDFAAISGKAQIAHPTRLGPDGQAWQTNADEAFYMTAVLRNGAVGTVEANKLAFGTNDDLTVEIYGERGAIRYSLMQPNYLQFYDGERKGGDLGGNRGFTMIECVGRFPAPGGIFPGVKAPTGWLMSHVGSMHAFLTAVRDGREATPSFDDGAYIQLLMERAYQSAEQNGAFLTI